MSTFQSLTINKDGFAFDLLTGESFQLNRCGQMVLQRLRHGDTQEQIMLFLCGRFGISQNIAQRDITDFYQQLNALGLLTEENQ
ncbi:MULTISPECIES: PqqD family protein [Nostocales]|uniref:PqqD family protein n=3 Tax=Nostocales TaxID=1161 RepID=A0A0C1N8Y3_9CYAN|nr:PqqD family protein [Tolypothrix bouteillei]KAF3885249.1 PqqD family protein [Tolypothrix bouteillei VB521301]